MKLYRIIPNGRPSTEIRIPIRPFTLSFYTESLQNAFRHYHTLNSLSYVRLTLLLAILLFMGFAWLDRVLVPVAADTILTLRIFCALFFLLIYAVTYTRFIYENFQLAMSLVVLLGGTGIIGIIYVTGNAGSYYYYAGLILAVMYAHGLLRLRFIYATAATWIVILLYHVLAATISDIPYSIQVNNAFFLVSANVMGMFSSYWLEYYMRTEFWQTCRLKEKSAELEIEHQRKTEELETLRNIQLSMLPHSSPYFPGYEFSFVMRTAAEIGGDYYDCIVSEDRTLTFAIGDATGHGVRAGAMVTAVKVLFADHGPVLSVTDFLHRANHSIRQMGMNQLYMAFAIGKLTDHTLEIAGAGIPAALIYRNQLEDIEQIPLTWMPLGSPLNFPYKKITVQLDPGDTLLLMTDGYPELFNQKREMLGYERTQDQFKKFATGKPHHLLDQLLADADAWLDGHPQDDDMTFLVIKRKPVKVSTDDQWQEAPPLMKD